MDAIQDVVPWGAIPAIDADVGSTIVFVTADRQLETVILDPQDPRVRVRFRTKRFYPSFTPSLMIRRPPDVEIEAMVQQLRAAAPSAEAIRVLFSKESLGDFVYGDCLFACAVTPP